MNIVNSILSRCSQILSFGDIDNVPISARSKKRGWIFFFFLMNFPEISSGDLSGGFHQNFNASLFF